MSTVESNGFSIIVFPYLKTSNSFNLGHIQFHSSDNVEGLKDEELKSLNEISEMMFLQNDLKIKSFTYACIPKIDFYSSHNVLEILFNIQSFIGYLYSNPRHETSNLFLSFEHASLVIFSRDEIFKCLISPNINTVDCRSVINIEDETTEKVSGYEGMFNFSLFFWVSKGSRVYGPLPHMTLNISQDLSSDINSVENNKPDCSLLKQALNKPSNFSQRVFRAVSWYNLACKMSSGELASIVNLSIAFESLLELPKEQKTSRFIDSISLLLGRTPRLDSWATQFYNARSNIVHQGKVQQSRFIVNEKRNNQSGQPYQSLLTYGREIFQMCLGTVLFGGNISNNSNLEEKFISNQERFEKLCKELSYKGISAKNKLEFAFPLILSIDNYKFVPENQLKYETMLSSAKLVCQTFLECAQDLSTSLEVVIQGFINAKGSDDSFFKFEALSELTTKLRDAGLNLQITSNNAFSKLIEIVWGYVFTHYFWLKGKREIDPNNNKSI